MQFSTLANWIVDEFPDCPWKNVANVERYLKIALRQIPTVETRDLVKRSNV